MIRNSPRHRTSKPNFESIFGNNSFTNMRRSSTCYKESSQRTYIKLILAKHRKSFLNICVLGAEVEYHTVVLEGLSH